MKANRSLWHKDSTDRKMRSMFSSKQKSGCCWSILFFQVRNFIMTVLWCSGVCEKFVKYYDFGRVIQILIIMIIFHLRAGQDICCWPKVVSIKGNIADGKCKKRNLVWYTVILFLREVIFSINMVKKIILMGHVGRIIIWMTRSKS